MKIEILKTTVANKQFVRAGEIIEVSESDARLLVGMGKAQIVGDSVAPEAPVAVEVADAPLDTEAAAAVIETKTKKQRKK
jgi:hypothetical protein